MKSITVFCGSRSGVDPAFNALAVELANILFEKKITLVYGGSNVGLMGVIADRMLDLGGKVIGVYPTCLPGNEPAHSRLTQLIYVDSFQDRKEAMNNLADGFITLPGGFGSMDELFEMLTYAQLGFHQKPCGILDNTQYYFHLLKFIDHATSQGFINCKDRDLIINSENPRTLLKVMSSM